jgi:hypothetical protein
MSAWGFVHYSILFSFPWVLAILVYFFDPNSLYEKGQNQDTIISLTKYWWIELI